VLLGELTIHTAVLQESSDIIMSSTFLLMKRVIRATKKCLALYLRHWPKKTGLNQNTDFCQFLARGKQIFLL
jgi:hypothetical protein